MTTIEYALPVGCTIASFVGAWLSRTWAKESGYCRDSANAAANRANEDANRVARQSQIVHDLHDCVRQAVPVKPYLPGSFREMVEHDAKQPPTDPTPTLVNFDLPKTLDPEGRTGELK